MVTERTGVVVGVDTGGTFTDVFASNGQVRKVPSTPGNPAEAILAGIQALDVDLISAVAHGTTVATNAVLERKGARTLLLTTAGFEDVLEIRRQNRPSLYDFRAVWPPPLVPRALRLGVPERLDFRGDVVTPLDENMVSVLLDGCEVESIAVCLLFSYANPEHERKIGQLIYGRFGHQVSVSLSSDVAPQYGEYERTSTTVVNAYVLPIMARYLELLRHRLERLDVPGLHIMHSNGGLVSAQAAARRPVLTILSGPAAGVVGAQALGRDAGYPRIITFDMGGTSTDVSLVPDRILESSEGVVSGCPLLVPMLTIETVGAGGGSIARVDAGGALHVGPESAGAFPGPAAYGHGSQPTVTDANLVLGRLSTRGLLDGAMPLDVGRAERSLESIARRLHLTLVQAAWAVVRVANSNMERAVRTVTLQRGFDPGSFTLFAFGGAGPLHAAEMADGLGITSVLVPPHPGVMAALGLTVPDVVRDFFRTLLLPLKSARDDEVEAAFVALERQALAELEEETLPGFGSPTLERSVDLRYVGQSFDLRVPYSPETVTLVAAFAEIYEERYGYATPAQPVEVVNVRVRAVLPRLNKPNILPPWPEGRADVGERVTWFGSGTGVSDLQALAAQMHWRPALTPGSVVEGPAVLEQYDSTTLIPPGWIAKVDASFNVILTRSIR